MSDSRDKGDPNRTPEGMVRKTRRVRKKRRNERPVASAKEEADNLFAKAKDLLIGMHDEDEDYGPIDVAEQVRRLKKRKEDERPLDDIWGTKRRSTSWLWIVLSGAIVSVVAIVVGITIWAKDDSSAGTEVEPSFEDERFKVENVNLAEGPLGWFNDNSLEVVEEVEDIIEEMNEAEEVEELSKLIRDSPFRSFHPIELEKIGPPMQTNSLANFRWTPRVVYSSEESGSKERGYLKVSGLREDKSPYELFFVVEDNRIVLDWDATQGWSEMPLSELSEEKPRKPMLMRCRVSKHASYDQKFGETPYSGYVISGDSADNFIFAYVNLDTPGGRSIDRDLQLLLNYGSWLTDEPPRENAKVTLRVRFRESIGEKGQFEISEFLHGGWVTP